jgi:prolyl oligopeptidase
MKITSGIAVAMGLMLQLTILNAQYKYLPTIQDPVTDNYFGIKVTDNYRWLEKVDDPLNRIF